MSVDGFTLQVPADAEFCQLAAEVAGRYVNLAGGTDAEAASLAGAISEALESVAKPGDGPVDVTFRSLTNELEVVMRCGARSSTIHHAWPAARR
jgi:hypothetical protein